MWLEHRCARDFRVTDGVISLVLVPQSRYLAPPMPPRWTHPRVKQTYSIMGGYLTRPLPVVTLNLSDVIPHDTDDAPAVARDDLSGVFVKLDKSAEWMIKAVGGSSAQRGFLRRTTLIEELRSKMNNGCVADADDPMASLCDVEQTHDTPKKKCRYTKPQHESRGDFISSLVEISCDNVHIVELN